MQKEPNIWKPSEEQALLLAADEEQVLYGGEPGCGKSDALLVDALGLNVGAIHSPGYKALITRSTFPLLDQLVERSREIYPSIFPNVNYKMFSQRDNVKQWEFPTGAKIRFGYLAKDADKYQYSGPQFVYIGIDELTQLELESTYRFMLTRNRNAYGLKNYMRATCNPDGPGYMWVKNYWSIPYNGADTKKTISIDVGNGKTEPATLRFIRGRMKNNKYISESDYLKKLAQLPPKERERLMYGLWPDSDESETLISSKSVRDAAERLITDVEPIGPIILGIDPSYKGKDGSVFCIRQGRLVLYLETMYNVDTIQQAIKAIKLIEKFDVDAVAVDFAYGSGVYDQLRQLDYSHMIYLIHFNSKSINENLYFNKRAEIYGMLANWIENEAPKIPNNESLINQLEYVPYKFNLGKIKIKEKIEIKKILGKSPDQADALALTFSVPHVHRNDDSFQEMRSLKKSHNHQPKVLPF